MKMVALDLPVVTRSEGDSIMIKNSSSLSVILSSKIVIVRHCVKGESEWNEIGSLARLT